MHSNSCYKCHFMTTTHPSQQTSTRDIKSILEWCNHVSVSNIQRVLLCVFCTASVSKALGKPSHRPPQQLKQNKLIKLKTHKLIKVIWNKWILESGRVLSCCVKVTMWCWLCGVACWDWNEQRKCSVWGGRGRNWKTMQTQKTMLGCWEKDNGA